LEQANKEKMNNRALEQTNNITRVTLEYW